MNKKLFAVLLSVLFLFNVLCIAAYAEEVVDSEPVLESTSSTVFEEFRAKVEAYASTGFSNTVSYTSDSVSYKGVSLEAYTDTLKFETGFVVRTNLQPGVEIYDDPTTDVIEGIRVNGNAITNLKIPVDLDNPQNYLVEVRLVYAEGLLGTVAKISNGDFTIQTIMEEPLLVLQLVYYIIAAISIVVGGLGACASKKKKVKTAEDIASIVDIRVKEGCEAFAVEYADLLQTNLLPIFNNVVDTNKAIVKAVTISTSKTKEAPIALLDVLKEVSDVDIEKTIDEARQKVLKNIEDADTRRAAVRSVLERIANGTYQEVQNVKTNEETESSSEDIEKITKNIETKSIF